MYYDHILVVQSTLLYKNNLLGKNQNIKYERALFYSQMYLQDMDIGVLPCNMILGGRFVVLFYIFLLMPRREGDEDDVGDAVFFSSTTTIPFPTE